MKNTLGPKDVKFYLPNRYRKQYLTADQIKNLISRDSTLYYPQWDVDLENLWQIVSLSAFPQATRAEIASSIIQCAVKTEDLFCDGNYAFENMEIIQKYYRVLTDDSIRKNYLAAIAKREIEISYSGSRNLSVIAPWHSGKIHRKYENAFIKREVNTICRRESKGKPTNLAIWRQTLGKKYQKRYQKDAETGKFEEDREYIIKRFREIYGHT